VILADYRARKHLPDEADPVETVALQACDFRDTANCCIADRTEMIGDRLRPNPPHNACWCRDACARTDRLIPLCRRRSLSSRAGAFSCDLAHRGNSATTHPTGRRNRAEDERLDHHRAPRSLKIHLRHPVCLPSLYLGPRSALRIICVIYSEGFCAQARQRVSLTYALHSLPGRSPYHEDIPARTPRPKS